MVAEDDDGDELAAALRAMRVASLNVIGFHDLAEGEPRPSPLDRMRFEAMAYAYGYELAVQVARLSSLLKDRP